MKRKIATLFLVGSMMTVITGCSIKSGDMVKEEGKTSSVTSEVKEEMPEKSKFMSGEEILNKVYETYKEDQKFPIEGGDIENPTIDKAAANDISKKEELDLFLGLPSSLAEKIDGAASMIHQLNANTFTGAAYHMKEGVDKNEFAKEMKAHLDKKQWICGAPNSFLVIEVDKEYLITVFGNNELTEVFKKNATEILEGSKVILDDSLVQ